MLRPKVGCRTKPSKASLRSRGLSSNALRGQRPGSTTSSVDGRYSLYSTDSEDNVSGVSKGLDKCAQLLTNILEVNVEKDTHQQSQHPPNERHPRKVLPWKPRKPTGYHISKPNTNKPKTLKSKQKQKSVVQIPTSVAGGTQSTTTKFVSSTPVLAVEQCRKQQELKNKEQLLQQQIDLLQAQYDNLQGNVVHPMDHASPREPADGDQKTLRDKELSEGNKADEAKSARTTRRSLEFPTNAEKPFIDSKKGDGKSPSASRETQTSKTVKAKKVVRILTQDCYHAEQDINQDTPAMETFEPKKEKTLYNVQVGHSNNVTEFDAVQNGNEVNKVKGDTSPDVKLNPQKNTDHLRILLYLVGELKSVLENIEDVEVSRLLMEIENELCLLSYPVQSPMTVARDDTKPVGCKQHDIDTEVALQPLRCENSDLRRKLRIANQKLREAEMARQGEKTQQISNGLVESLHNQLLQERENFGKERQQKEILEKQLSEQIHERKRTQTILSGKEEAIVKLNDELRLQKDNTTTVISQMKLELESSTISLRARDKEITLVNLALKQRDTEIERLTELTRGLQQSLTKVLTNVQGLHPDDVMSEMSSLHSFLDPLQQPVLHAVDLSFTPPDDEVGRRHEVGYNQGTREYTSDTRVLLQSDLGGPSGYTRRNHEQTMYNDKGSPDVKHQENMSFLSSSGEESTFNKELANLDDAIARLQINLRGKLSPTLK